MAKKFIEYSHIHTVHRDYQHQLSFNSLNEAWMLSSNDSGEHLDLGDLDSGYSLFLAVKNIVLLDVPTHQMMGLNMRIEEEENGVGIRLTDK